MRFRELNMIMEEVVQDLKINVKEVPNNSGIRNISDHVKTILAIQKIEETGLFSETIDKIKTISSIYNDRTSSINVSVSEANRFNQLIAILEEKCATIIEVFENTYKKHNETVLNIKLPEYHSLKELSEFTSKLDKAISQIIHEEKINGKITLCSLESGSMWINIDVNTVQAVTVIGMVVWSAMVIRKKKIEGDLVKKTSESAKIGNEALQLLKDHLEKELNLLCEVEAKQILSDNGIENTSPEYLERLKYSIKMIADLIREGAEIHHSLMAPEKVNNLFPDFNKIDIIESKIQKIESGNNDINI
jgi:predicted DNA binding protein